MEEVTTTLVRVCRGLAILAETVADLERLREPLGASPAP